MLFIGTQLERVGNVRGHLEAAAALAGSPHLANLVRLDLRSNALEDDAVLRLLASPRLAGLLAIDLRGNKLGTRTRRNLRRRRSRNIVV